MKNPFLIGQRIYLRPLEREDAPHFVSWMNDPEVSRFLLFYRPINVPWEEDFIARTGADPNDVILGIAVKGTDQLLGGGGLHKMDVRNRHVSFGIAIGDKEQWGKGYGREATELLVRHAFETLNLNRVWLQVFEYNERAIRTYERVGFRREGVLRQDNFRDGRYWNTVVMGMLREEWHKFSRDPQGSAGGAPV